jgi:diguanylate cyclase (GGDEF)-like protein
VVGISLAVLGLGTLAVWAAIVTQNGAEGLTRAGVQTSGHLRAVQALSLIDTETDALEERIIPSRLAKLRRAQRVLDEALARMEHGGVRQASRIAEDARPIMLRLKPEIERFLARPPGVDSDGSSGDEEAMENTMAELQQILNDLDPDPSHLLATKLGSVTASERRIRQTALVLVPLGLGGVAVCGWLLNVYRRRSEETMLLALDTTTHEARTDQLTGLANRRALLEEMERRIDGKESFMLALADLNGFKRYNDNFGHPAGDALLRRLGRQLERACENRGLAARLGGDEFCVLLDGDTPAEDVQRLAETALSERGDGFSITAASGVAAVPHEAHGTSAAMRLADTRMYAAKVGAHPSAEHAVCQALRQVLDERHPGLGEHVDEVAELAVACTEALGLAGEERDTIGRAAELHDLGKIGIPSSILTKAGPLSADEWDFMRRHSAIGERILAGIPTMHREASMVRATHERWDGTGYPDALAGEQIPLGSRIIAVADAFCAMTEHRPYAEERSLESAKAELSACAGTQFDPRIVTAFLSAIAERRASGEPALIA